MHAYVVGFVVGETTFIWLKMHVFFSYYFTSFSKFTFLKNVCFPRSNLMIKISVLNNLFVYKKRMKCDHDKYVFLSFFLTEQNFEWI